MRLFIATALSNESCSQALHYQPLVADGASLSRPDQLHMTLQFIGEAEPEQIIPALEDICFAPFNTHFTKTGIFKPKKGKRVLWLGIQACRELLSLHESITHGLLENNIKIDTRNYQPHITLARCKPSIDQAYLDHFLGQKVDNTRYSIRQFHLYRSHRVESRLRYDILESFNTS